MRRALPDLEDARERALGDEHGTPARSIATLSRLRVRSYGSSPSVRTPSGSGVRAWTIAASLGVRTRCATNTSSYAYGITVPIDVVAD